MNFISWVKKLSYREGDFTLSSGLKSSFYVDLKATTLHPEGAYLIGKESIVRLVETLGESGVRALGGVGGLTLGADPIATSISLAARESGFFLPAFLVRKEAKKHGTSRYIEGIENLKPGSQVIILEDVVTTGASSVVAIERAREAGFQVEYVLTVVDRQEGGEAVLAKHGCKMIALCTLSELKSHKA